MSDTRSPDLDARLSEDVQKGARVLSDRYARRFNMMTLDEDSGEWLRMAREVLSAANHAKRLAELERVHRWMRYAMEEMTAEQITRVTERAEYEGESLLDRVRVLEEALKAAYRDVINVAKDGRDSTRGETALRAIERISRALASSLETDTEDGGRDG
jgi:hypothetical protein